jgi:rubrerythrin
MAVREGKWRCPHCSAVNRGADLACGGCGATRDQHVTFFLSLQ